MAMLEYTDDLDLLSLQSEELSLDSMAQSDYDFAYQLQLQEALSASSAHDPPPLPPASPDDRSLALSLQSLELSQCQRQAVDHRQVAREAEQLQLEVRRRAHDAKFAQSLLDMDESDWENYGDMYEEPFVPKQAELDEDPLPCKLYFKAVSLRNARPSPTTPSAMGAVVLDSKGNVLTELQKSLDLGTGKTAADYMALISGLEAVHALGLRHAEAHTDSVIVYNQVTGRWRVRTRKMQGLWSQVMEHVGKLQSFDVFLHPQSENKHAVRLAREAINLQLAKGNNNAGSQKSKQASELCTICLEETIQSKMYSVSGCLHRFCLSCVVQHSEVKVQAGQVPVRCPQVDCRQTLSLAECQTILSSKWYDSLTKRLIEVNIPESERVYCPFPNCSALMNIRDMENVQGASSSSNPGSRAIGRAECVECHCLFCVECRVPWHASMSCLEYQRLPPGLRDAQDAKLYQLAEHQNWQRCKKCRRMIELSEGCYHMTCRCGYEFCYLCGAEWKNKRQTCKCRLWDEDNLLDEPISESEDDDFGESEDDDFDDSDEDDESYGSYGNSDGASDSNLQPENPFYKTKLCRHWARGNCLAGNGCNFAHGVLDLRRNLF